ncbi:hypothetical protein ABZ920_02145 [Streptomyces sp. NPDC046831]|uniref:hypothetical protein n=1 Tax=Streptomyces sp. NPDC046831 TaxID=3154805 RepID=UPI0033E2192E
MTGDNDEQGDRFDRARSSEEPGAHSGAESDQQERTIPGTASAAEGYQEERGTRAGTPLEGVEAGEESGPEREDEDQEGEPGEAGTPL